VGIVAPLIGLLEQEAHGFAQNLKSQAKQNITYCFMKNYKLSIVLFAVGLFIGRSTLDGGTPPSGSLPLPQPSMSYHGNIVKETAANQYFRHVLFTGAKTQLVVMRIPPGGEVGLETHKAVEQTLFFQSGTGQASLNGKISPIAAGDVVVVKPGTAHNFINNGTDDLTIFTIYAPPNHIDGRIQKTKADADADTADEAFGHKVGD
jgi:mannose-6-phosphate isomerase-like protein (cupin superfamily)